MIQPPNISPLGLALAGIATVLSDAGFELGGVAFNGFSDRFDLGNSYRQSVIGTGVFNDNAVIGQRTRCLQYNIGPELAYFPGTGSYLHDQPIRAF